MNTNYRDYLIEFIGTFLLVFTIGMVSVSSQISNFDPLIIGLSLFLLIIIGGHISGGYYNPAVSIAMLMQKTLTFDKWVGYILAQIIAAFLASYIVILVSGSSIETLEIHFAKAFFVEFFFTFLLVFSILSLSIFPIIISSIMISLAVGVVISIGGITVGSISGASFNPATAIGFLVIGFYSLTDVFFILCAVILGGIAASSFFSLIKSSLPKIELSIVNQVQQKDKEQAKSEEEPETSEESTEDHNSSGIRVSRKHNILRTSN